LTGQAALSDAYVWAAASVVALRVSISAPASSSAPTEDRCSPHRARRTVRISALPGRQL